MKEPSGGYGLMMQDEAIARIWMIRCDQETKLILLGLAISHHPAFVINGSLFDYLAYKIELLPNQVEEIFDRLKDCGAFHPTEPEPYVVLWLDLDVVACIERLS